MVGVLKVQNMDVNINHREIRLMFKEHGARPSDIHMITDINHKPTGSCFLSFEERDIAKLGLNVDGLMHKNKRVEVRESGPSEFNRYFPGISLISKPPGSYGKGKRMGITPNMKPLPFVGRSPAGRGRDHFERERRDNHPRDRRGRSRSPLNRRGEQGTRGEFLRNFGQQEGSSIRRGERKSNNNNRNDDRGAAPYHDPLANINFKKYLIVKMLPFDVSEGEIQNFFRPFAITDIFYLKHTFGKFAGKRNGSVIVEFLAENDAKKCIKLDGKRMRNKVAAVSRPLKNEVIEAIEDRLGSKVPPVEKQSSGVASNLSNLADIADSNPQVAHLLNLLTETVNAITTGSSSNTQRNDSKGSRSNSRRGKKRVRPGNDPVVDRVANNANIDANDITMGKVVGMRNLPFSVTPGEILQFFQGFNIIRDSVRIHYLDDGKCSGDGIITFERKRDAEKAVAALNKNTIARKRVTLFLL